MYAEIDFTTIDTSQEPPQEEPARQYYFIAKCRQHVKHLEEKLGRRPTFFTQTFGCQMNARDSEKLTGILQAAGYEKASSEEADFVIYNTCTVRENANQRVYGRLGYLHSLKKRNPHMQIALCGCMMQEAHVVEKLQKSYFFVDLIFGTHNLYKFAELLDTTLESDRMVVDVWEKEHTIVEDLPCDRKYSFKSGVNIMFGCNNFCSYCIVPYVRGRERSRSPEAISEEIRQLVQNGVREVMLLGQNVNSYGKDLLPPVSFARLLEELQKIPNLARIRFMTSHPKDLSPELIQVMAKYPKICRHLHLPLQSGSSRILQKMNRRYDKEDYLALTEKIREAVPDISLTTDIIVGFPGETEEDFLETLDVVERVGYDTAFTFLYSRRTGTPAAAMPEQIPEDVAKDRFDRLLALVQEKGRARSGRFMGSIQEVLVEEKNAAKEGWLTGRMSQNLLVHFPGSAALIGELLPVRLTKCKGFYYIGEQVKCHYHQ